MAVIRGGKVIEDAVERHNLKVSLISGGAAGNHTVSGITTLDMLVSVLQLVGAGTDVTDIADLTSEFSISADNTINNAGGTDTTGSKLLVIWEDETP